MLRIVNGLAVANLHSPGFLGKRRALPGQSSYVQPAVEGRGGGGAWHGAYPTAVNHPYLKLRMDPFLTANNIS